MRRLRIPAAILSLLFLAFGLLCYLGRRSGGLGTNYFLPKPDERPRPAASSTAAPQCDDDADKIYAERLRLDAFRRLGKGEYEEAMLRLNQAKKLDPENDHAIREVREARLEIRRHLGYFDDPAAVPAPKATP